MARDFFKKYAHKKAQKKQGDHVFDLLACKEKFMLRFGLSPELEHQKRTESGN